MNPALNSSALYNVWCLSFQACSQCTISTIFLIESHFKAFYTFKSFSAPSHQLMFKVEVTLQQSKHYKSLKKKGFLTERTKVNAAWICTRNIAILIPAATA